MDLVILSHVNGAMIQTGLSIFFMKADHCKTSNHHDSAPSMLPWQEVQTDRKRVV